MAALHSTSALCPSHAAGHFFFFSSRRRHTRSLCDWSSDVCSSDLFGATGSVGWNFSVADGALDFLAAGQMLVQKYNVTVADNHGGTVTQIVTVTLTGTNDPTVIVGAALANSVIYLVPELAGGTGSAAVDTASGMIAFTDVDLTDTHRGVSVVPQGAGYLGSFTLGTLADSTGGVSGSIHWTFSVVDGALDFLAAGQKLIQSYAVTIGDFHNGPATQIVTMTLTGTNDAPVANPDVLTPAQAQGNLWTTLLANDTDIDTAHNLLTITAVNTTGMFGTSSSKPPRHFLP